MTASALMILGTASHVGKSTITAGLGRIFANEGVRVAPFKAQNMSLNSAATPEGREIGRAQALQAEACRLTPSVEMNPILIKPRSDTSSQVVLLGKVWGQVTAADYHSHRVEQLFPIVLHSYRQIGVDLLPVVKAILRCLASADCHQECEGWETTHRKTRSCYFGIPRISLPLTSGNSDKCGSFVDASLGRSAGVSTAACFFHCCRKSRSEQSSH